MPTKKFYSTGEIAKQIGVGRWRVINLVDRGQYPEPMRIGGKRIFTLNDLNKIRKFFAKGGSGESEK